MSLHTYYTAVGQYHCKADGCGRMEPVVLCSQKEHRVDLQEMILWSALHQRLLDLRQAEQQYRKLSDGLLAKPPRTFDACLDRLCLRGIVAKGRGETGLDALYDLLSVLYVTPVKQSAHRRLATCLRLKLSSKDRHSSMEHQIMCLSRQARLSTAELIKCVENGVKDLRTPQKVMDALYRDRATTRGNMMSLMRDAKSMQAVVITVSNLYLRQQITLERD